MKKLIIMRGLPGSGKSWKVREIIGAYGEIYGKTTPPEISIVQVSADDYFYGPDGEYHYIPSRISEAHCHCFYEAMDALCGGVNLVIVDNTNILHNHYSRYEQIAKALGYEVEIVVVGEFTKDACKAYALRNIHGVPVFRIYEMAEKFEKGP
jgi:tRNA uridine 5-carbamoylmethylation protein Kti12